MYKNSIFDADFAKYLPTALQRDPKMVALAKAAADEITKAAGVIDNVLIYARIDDLPEELVDILAYDMHVDWYDFNYPLEAKRDLVKNSVNVHRKMGTKKAIETALGGLFSGSEVEEWFDYSGEPGHFRIIIDITNQRITASYQEIIRAVKLYKRLSAHMDAVTYQGSIHTVIKTHAEHFKYTTPITGRLEAGTHPQRNVVGGQSTSIFVVGTEKAGFIFHSPQAGTKPYRNMLFDSQTEQIKAETLLNAFGYTNIAAGKIKAGEAPQRNYKGQQNGAENTLETQATAYTYTVPAAGTVPDRSTTEETEVRSVENKAQAMGFSYSVKACGSTRKL